MKPIRTSAYLPQTDSLVERFNGTLKSMLRKAATEEEKDWDELIPYLLFAYREVPQASTGFSPFELVYGQQVRGPLDVLKEEWKVCKRACESIVSYVLGVHEKLIRCQLSYGRTWKRHRKCRRPGMIRTQGSGSSMKETRSWYYCRRLQASY